MPGTNSSIELQVLVGRQLSSESEVLVNELTQLLASRIPELSRGTRLIEMLRGSIAGNVNTVTNMLVNSIDVDATQPPTAAVEYAVRHAQNNLPASSLIRAYQVGQRLLLERAIELVSSLDSTAQEQLLAIRAINEKVHAYTDRVLQVSVDTYENERRQFFTARARAGRAITQAVLRGENISTTEFEVETRYSLKGKHRAFLLWLDTPPRAEELATNLESIARRVAALISREEPLLISLDATTFWGWTHDLGAPKFRSELTRVGAEYPNVRISFGQVGSGIEGFRRSHEQARDAQLVGTDSKKFGGAPIISSDDPGVGLAALLLRDAPAARAWADEILGIHAGPSSTARAVRETLVTYLSSGQSLVRTAEILGVHRNTVTARIDRTLEARNGVSADLVELAVAARIVDLFEG